MTCNLIESDLMSWVVFGRSCPNSLQKAESSLPYSLCTVLYILYMYIHLCSVMIAVTLCSISFQYHSTEDKKMPWVLCQRSGWICQIFIRQKIIDTTKRTWRELASLFCPPIHFTCHVVEAQLTLRGPLSCSICSFRLWAFKASHFPVTVRERSTH